MGGSTEGTGVQSGSSMIAGRVVPNVPPDTDLLSIWIAQGAINIFRPGGLSVTKFGDRFVISVRGEKVSSFSTENAAGRRRDLAAAFRKGSQRGGQIAIRSRLRR